MKIRTCEAKDHDQVIGLWRDCGLVVGWNDPSADILRKMVVAPDLFLVGEIENEIVASVMGGYDGHRGWINYLAGSPGQQGSGLGRVIMSEVEKRIRAKGCPKINLQVRSTNSAVIQFYKAIGYRVDEVVSLGKRLVDDKV